MQKMRLTTTLFALLSLLIAANCAGNGEPTVEPTPEPTQPPSILFFLSNPSSSSGMGILRLIANV